MQKLIPLAGGCVVSAALCAWGWFGSGAPARDVGSQEPGASATGALDPRATSPVADAPGSWDEIADSDQLVELQREAAGRECPACDGHGTWIGGTCWKCGGDGVVGGAPVAEAPGSGRIRYESEAAAKRAAALDGKPLWYHVTLSRGCRGCVVADGQLGTPMAAAESGRFHCVLVTDPPAGHAWMKFYGIGGAPADVFTSADGRRWLKREGAAANVGELLLVLDRAARELGSAAR